MSSPLSMSVKRLAQILKDGAEGQVGESEGRLQTASDNYWPLVKDLLITEFKFDKSHETALRLFSKDKARFAAVDGSEDQRLLGGLAVFWAGSYAATGSITFYKDQQPDVEYDTGFVERGQGLASCVPIYVDSLPEVEPQSTLHKSGQQFTISGPMTEQSTVDNSTIADWIMLFSEIYLAHQLAASKEYEIILLDRSLSGTLSNLIYDTAKRPLWKRQCAIFGFEIDNVPIDEPELAYGRYHTPKLDGSLPPRGDYLRYSAILLLQKHNRALSLSEIANELNYSAEDQLTRLTRFVKKSTEEGYLQESNAKYSATPRYSNTWNRLRKLVELFGARFFTGSTGNPLRIADALEPRWITTLDLAFLCLFAFNLLIEESQENHILLLGITKETTARDLISHLIPVSLKEGIWKQKVHHVATTDRMLLQAISMFHHSDLPIPWATLEYDTAFQTIVPDFQHREGYVSGAISNRIILEQRFVKSYIQLDKAKSDDQFRSNVLFIDRLYHDLEKAPTLKLKHDYASTIEEIQPVLWDSKLSPNRVQELTMVTLKAMTQQSLPEVFGHNKPLYIADKIVKAQRDRAGEIVKATGHWLVIHPKLRKFSFYMNTFRARRSEVESARTRA
ncbi:MAG: hypothetical protein WB643_10015 [Candidatus Bathyarchaeia archaeon]